MRPSPLPESYQTSSIGPGCPDVWDFRSWVEETLPSCMCKVIGCLCASKQCVCVVVVVDLVSSFFLLFISYFHWGCYPYKLKSQMTEYQVESSNLCFGKVHVGFCFVLFFLFLSAEERPFCNWVESLKIGMGASR